MDSGILEKAAEDLVGQLGWILNFVFGGGGGCNMMKFDHIGRAAWETCVATWDLDTDPRVEESKTNLDQIDEDWNSTELYIKICLLS